MNAYFKRQLKAFFALANSAKDTLRTISGKFPLVLQGCKGNNCIKELSITGDNIANGTNLLNFPRSRVINDIPSSTSTARDFDGTGIYVGLAFTNAFSNGQVADFSMDRNGVWFRSGNGYGVSVDVKVKPNTVYTISYKYITGAQRPYITYAFFNATKKPISYKGGFNNSNLNVVETPTNCEYLILCLRTDPTSVPSRIYNINVVEGEYTADTIPEYTPSEGVGVKTVNLCRYTIGLGEPSQTAGFQQSSFISAGRYTFSCNVENATKWRYYIRIYDTDGNVLNSGLSNFSYPFYSTGSSWRASSDTNIKSFSFDAATDCYILIRLEYGDTSTNTIISNAQLQSGSSATDYEPYGYKIPLKISAEIRTKNLFDADTIFGAIDGAKYEDGYWIFSILKARNTYGANDGQIPLYNFKENTQYTVSLYGRVSDHRMTINFRYTDGTTAYANFQSNMDELKTITTPVNKTVEKIYFSYGNNSAGNPTNDYIAYVKWFQIEEGAVATDYEPYGYKTESSTNYNLFIGNTQLYATETVTADFVKGKFQRMDGVGDTEVTVTDLTELNSGVIPTKSNVILFDTDDINVEPNNAEITYRYDENLIEEV